VWFHAVSRPYSHRRRLRVVLRVENARIFTTPPLTLSSSPDLLPQLFFYSCLLSSSVRSSVACFVPPLLLLLLLSSYLFRNLHARRETSTCYPADGVQQCIHPTFDDVSTSSVVAFFGTTKFHGLVVLWIVIQLCCLVSFLAILTVTKVQQCLLFNCRSMSHRVWTENEMTTIGANKSL
jgi:hypothetical protein